jgi:hypothetical protein
MRSRRKVGEVGASGGARSAPDNATRAAGPRRAGLAQIAAAQTIGVSCRLARPRLCSIRSPPLAGARTTDLLDPKNGHVFKRIFADAPVLLAALIDAVLAPAAPVVVVSVRNPGSDPAEPSGKYIVLDLLA